MRLETVPARRGIAWVREGFVAVTRRPFAFAALFMVVMFATLLVQLLPWLMIGVLPLIMLVPLGFMIATRIVLNGGRPTPRVFIDPLRVDRPRTIALLRLGLVYAVAMFVVIVVSGWSGGDAPGDLLEAASPAASAPDAAASAASTIEETPASLPPGLWLTLTLAALLSIPFWHAPALVHWAGQGCAQSLFTSTLACWRNRGAFAVYGLVWFGLAAGFGTLFALLVAAFGPSQWLMIAAYPVGLIGATAYYASLYFTFADCFSAIEPIPPRKAYS